MDQVADLASLVKGREKRAIVVRVVRKWTVKGDGGQGTVLYVGMIVADAKGNALYAEILDNVVPKKEYLADVGKVYVIKKFQVQIAKPTYRAIDRELMIEITLFTSIEVARDYPATIPEYVYSLTPFSALEAVGKTIFNFTDVIGYVSEYTALETFVPKNKEKVTNLRKLYIKDLNDNILPVTLWGEHAINFSVDNVYDEKAGNVVVCLLVGCVPRRDYKDYDQLYLSGSSAFTYYLNPQIKEAIPFYSKFKDTPIYIQRPTKSDELAMVPVADTPLKLMTVADLDAIIDPFDFEDGTYKCNVTVTSILTDINWWYMSCRRHKKKAVQQDDRSYRCTICNGSDIVPRYLLSFMAKDDTGEARFFAHDTEATAIVGKECEAVMNPLGKAGDLPKQMQNLINKEFVFSIDLSDSSWRQYLVKAVLERPTKQRDKSNSVPSLALAELPTESPVAQPTEQLQIKASGNAVQNPGKHQDVLLLQSGGQVTPPPQDENLDCSSKNTQARIPAEHSGARKKLFGNTAAVEQDGNDQTTDVVSETTEPLQPLIQDDKDEDTGAALGTTELLPADPVEPKAKRTKNKASANKGASR